MAETESLKGNLTLIGRRHIEWTEQERRWQFLLDSLEGGERYRQAIYGRDRRGFPLRNLVRHKHEYPDPRDLNALDLAGSGYPLNVAIGAPGNNAMPGADPYQFAEDDDYELRRARTPSPSFVAEGIDTYLSKIFGCEVDRDAPEGPQFDGIRDWWADVDGMGTTIDQWMKDTIGPLLLALGQIDLLFDRPPAPDGAEIRSKADQATAGLNRCVATHILPQNMVDWVLNSDGSYRECLYIEYLEGEGEIVGTGIGPVASPTTEARVQHHYRRWTATETILYDGKGKELTRTDHPYGRVPIFRAMDRRKLRSRNIGQSRFEFTAERQREYYNLMSELVLANTLQAHPLLQGPEDVVQPDGTIGVGPSNLLVKVKSTSGGSVSYEGYEYVSPPKDPAESIRQSMRDIADDIDRDLKLMKPAGAAGTGRTTVAQSGISKQFDHEGLHATLSNVAKVFEKAEAKAVEFALIVLFDGKPPAGMAQKVTVAYPTVFNLYAAEDLARVTTDLQGILAAAGEAPETETTLVCEIIRKALPGRDDKTYEQLDLEIAAAIKAKAARASELAEMAPPGRGSPPPGSDSMGAQSAAENPVETIDPDSDPVETPEPPPVSPRNADR